MNFEQGYFKDSKISNYEDYTQKKYDTLCEELILLGIESEDTIVDFGCATGALVSEFKKRGYNSIRGTDVSWWAIQEGRRIYDFNPDTLQHLNYSLLEAGAKWIFALDVLEHVGTAELWHIVDLIQCEHLVVRMPVCSKEGDPYVLPVSRNDKTHIQCHTKIWWMKLLESRFVYEGSLKGKAIYDSDGVFAAVFKCEQ